MKRVIVLVMIFLVNLSWAHFGVIIPSNDMVMKNDPRQISLTISFIHPMEMVYMDMEKPQEFGVFTKGKRINLTSSLEERRNGNERYWVSSYRFKRPGDYLFYVIPKPYWEPAEDCFIQHLTKVVVNFMDLQDGWDKEIGLKAEIVPMSRPYGLWAGNIFQGVVKYKGKPVPYAEVEVEYYNDQEVFHPEKSPQVTQVIRADANGVFTYAMPVAGWWGFAALMTDEQKIKYRGEPKDVEIGAVIWVKTYPISK